MIKYQDHLIGVEVGQLGGFFAGWPNPPNKLVFYKLLDNAYRVVIARDGDKVVGFTYAISDEVLSAYIPLLEVLPEYKSKGIGKELIIRLQDQLKDLYMVDVLCDEDVQPFYTKLGMTKAHGAFVRNYGKQSGS